MYRGYGLLRQKYIVTPQNATKIDNPKVVRIPISHASLVCSECFDSKYVVVYPLIISVFFVVLVLVIVLVVVVVVVVVLVVVLIS
jgi:hypothetical protein